jgi:hypothetical protein
MLKIRQEQAVAFENRAFERFIQNAIIHLRQQLSERIALKSDQELANWVRDARQRAKTFNLVTEKQIMCFLDAEVLLGQKYYEAKQHNWAWQVLKSKKLGPDDKAGLLLATACSFAKEQGAQ